MVAAPPVEIGKYRLLRKLATGGMAEVFLAQAAGPAGFQKTLVLKRILPHLADVAGFIEMFLNEARLAALLNHPNVVQIFDLGEVDGTWFIAMEYIDGPNLRALCRKAAEKGRIIPFEHAAKIISLACEGLAYAHDFADNGRALNLIHRDISPDNILLSRTGAVKVVDFGIAKAVGQEHLTKTGTLKGKLAYMPPEQLRGRALDKRADIFALGVVLYELLAGMKPFDATSEVAAMQAILHDPPTPLDERRSDCPAEIAVIVERALAKDREDRFPDCRAMQVELDRFLVTRKAVVGAFELARLVAEIVPPLAPPAATPLPSPVPSSELIPIELTPKARPPPARQSALEAEITGTDSPIAAQPSPIVAKPPAWTSGPPKPVAVQPLPESRDRATLELKPSPPEQPRPESPPGRRAPSRSSSTVAYVVGSFIAVAGVGLAVILLTREPSAEVAPPEAPQDQTDETARQRLEAAAAAKQRAADEARAKSEAEVKRQADALAAKEREQAEAAAKKAADELAAREKADEIARQKAEELAKAREERNHPRGTRTFANPRVEKPRDDPKIIVAAKAPETTPVPTVPAKPAAAPPVLSLDADPPCLINVDGRPYGQTPSDIKDLAPGAHTVTLSNRENNLTRQLPVSLVAGETRKEKVKFVKGSIAFRVRPYGHVEVDGKPMGQTPILPVQVYEGDHRIRVINPETHKEKTQTVTVRPGKEEVVKVNFEE